MELIKSGKGSDKLLHDGFSYTKKSVPPRSTGNVLSAGVPPARGQLLLIHRETYFTMDDNEHRTDQHISTFVFLDFESTGLLNQQPRITELCLLAVRRQDLLTGGPFPRTVNKLTLCLNPQKLIGLIASQITGLYNASLELQDPFNEDTVKLISSFLKRLQAPVCLVAHYGNGFDFPLLMAEMNRINESLDHTVLCADSLEAFRVMDELEPRMTYLPPVKRKHVGGVDHSHNVVKTGASVFPRTGTSGKKMRKSKSLSFETRSDKQTNTELRKATSLIQSSVTTPTTSNTKSYKLGEIYARLYGNPPEDAHRAEDDCVTMVKCVQRSKGFLEWVDQNAVPLSTIEPAYKRV